MTKKTRILALLAAVIVCSVMLFSSVFVVTNAGHDCTGEDCPICDQIHTCENTLKTLSNAAPVIALAIVFTYSFLAGHSLLTAGKWVRTLISLKVKLSN